MKADTAGREDTGLRDGLAVERTKLAEERTCLAYLRTGMSTLLGGVFFIGYFQEGLFSLIGYATVALSLVFFSYGVHKHRKATELLGRLAGAVRGFGRA